MPTSTVAQVVFCCDMDQHCFSCCPCLDKDTCLQTRSPASEHSKSNVQHNCVSDTIIVKVNRLFFFNIYWKKDIYWGFLEKEEQKLKFLRNIEISCNMDIDVQFNSWVSKLWSKTKCYHDFTPFRHMPFDWKTPRNFTIKFKMEN